MRWWILALVLVLGACAEPPRYSPLPPGTTVLAFGDSVTRGSGGGAGNDYPTQLAQATGWTVINAGVSRDTAAEGRYRLDALLAEHQPRLVLIGLGGNDFLRRRPANKVKEDLRAMVHSAVAHGAVPVLISAPELSVFAAATGRLNDSPIYAELAREENIVHVAQTFSSVLSDADLRSDRIHPNAEGYRIFTQGIVEQLTDAGLIVP